MAAVDEKVKQIIVEQLGVDEGEVTPTASFVDDLGADSLDTVELVMAFEEAFEIEIPDFGRNLARVFRSVKLGNRSDTALARQQVPPDLISFVADRADQANTGDDNSPHQSLPRFRVLADVIDRVLYGADFFRILVGNFDFEGFFERHYQFDGVQRVGAKIVHERSGGGHFALVHSQLFHNDLFYLFINGCHVSPRFSGICKDCRSKWKS